MATNSAYAVLYMRETTLRSGEELTDSLSLVIADQTARTLQSGDQALQRAIATISQSDPLVKLLEQVKLGRMKPTDAGLRAAYLSEAERMVLAENPVIPIYFYVSKHLVSPRVRGWTDNVLDYHYSKDLALAPE